MFQAHSRITRSNEASPSSSPMATTTAAAASGAVLNTSTDSNLDDDPNSSIINKVRSRVSSIIPDALSKWFSPAKRPRDTGNEQTNNSGGSGSPTGRNGNLLRRENRLRQFVFSGSEGTTDPEQQHNQYDDPEEDEEDEDHAPPIRKKKRMEEGFNATMVDFNEDLSAVPGPSGLNISAIDRRSSLPASVQLPQYYRNTFSSSTPSTSPQQQQQPTGSSVLGALNRQPPRTSLIGYTNRTTAPYNFGASTGPIAEEERDQSSEQGNESLSVSIRQRKGIREISSRKRLNIPPMPVDRSTSEPPAPIFGRRFPLQSQQQQLPEEGSSEELREEGNLLANGNLNESASESSSVSNLNLSQTEGGHMDSSRRLSGFMGNSRSKRARVGGSTGDLCFSSHLETEKSLFALKNSGQSGRPAFNASLYGSTSSLGSSNSSLFANSPFYNGRTMYGGASAYSSRRDNRQKALRVPVHIRPSSSLSNFSSSNTSLASDTSALSNTAKRILEILNQRSGPLTEARKLGSSLSLNSTLASSKVPGLVQARKRFNEEDLSMNRSIRMSSPRTPYSRPLSATGGIGSSTSSINKPPSTELQIPTMSQLLQMKRLQTNTESARRMATESSGSTVLNEPTQYKLPSAESDDTNNNVKHTSKMRNKLHRIREESLVDRSSNAPVPQVNLPEVQLAGLKSVPKFDIQLPISTALAVESSDKPKTVAVISNKAKNNAYKFSSPTKLDIASSGTSTTSKTRNNFKFSDPEPLGASKSSSTPAPSLKLGGFQFNPEMAKPKATIPTTQTSPTSQKPPLPLKSGSCLDALKSNATVPELKTGSCLDVLSKPVSPAVAIGNGSTSGFGSAFKLTGSNKWECDTCMMRNDQDKTKCVSCETPKPGSKPEAPKASSFSFGTTPVIASKSAPSTDSGFKALVAQQSAKWECSDCMTRNDSDKLKCVCCEKAKPGAAAAPAPAAAVPAAIKSMFSMPASSTDQGFKALVAQQSANKWECSACMTRNEASRSKCACCEQAKPGSTPEDAPSFSFGSKPSSSSGTKFSFGVPPSSEAKDAPKTGFSFGVPPASSATSTSTPPSTGFSFGSVTSTTNTTSSEDKPKFSFGSGTSTANASAPTTGSGFSFGVKPTPTSDTTDSPKTEKKVEPPKPTATIASSGFTFGAKPEAPKPSEAVTSTTTTSGFSFGSPSSKKPAEAPKTVGFSFGKPAETANAISTTASPVAKCTSNSDTTEQKKPTVSFGSLAAAAATTTNSSTFASTASPSFSFGPSASAATATKSTESKASPIVGSGMFSFGSPKTTVAASSAPTEAPAAESKPSSFSVGTAASSNVPIFGGAQKPSGPSITPSFSFGASAGSTVAGTTASSTASATAAPSTFSFGPASSKPAETSTTTTTVTAPTAAAPSFVFGQSGQLANKVVPTFGATAAAAPSDKSTFGTFGATATATGTANASAASASTGIFGNSTTTGTSGFGFGAATASATTPKPAESTASSAFTFGASKSISSLASSAAPVFGSPAAASSSTPIFGSPSTNTPTFGSFGNAAGSSTSSTPAFGSSTFGAAASPAGAGSTSGSIFGQVAAVAPAFGSAAGATAAPVFGAASPAFGASSPFGGASSASAAPTGDEPQAKKAFDFGSGPSTVNSQPAAPFQFGSSSNNNNNNDNNTKPFSFSANSAPSFNFTAGSNVGQTSAPFTFGSSQPVAPVASSGVFSFGAATGAGASAAPIGSGLGGMADAGTAARPVAAAPAAFQFGASSPMPQQNPFAATSIPGQTQQQAARRKIRATRRIITPR
ncbi:nuclear pore complex protein Nup153 isoform X2 [Aedes aegypti]|uniref:Nuclear pore complex protein Nup153 n=1 Tax=Aedes aegypti TaxID=7159 RepID=A0A6I8T6V7_AEDAE|nr:nuclear pore complex protein Nup153 isoform X2 [Aedes aegypti]